MLLSHKKTNKCIDCCLRTTCDNGRCSATISITSLLFIAAWILCWYLIPKTIFEQQNPHWLSTITNITNITSNEKYWVDFKACSYPVNLTLTCDQAINNKMTGRCIYDLSPLCCVYYGTECLYQ